MKNLNTYIHEKLTIVHKSYSCAPKTKVELRKIIIERLKEDPDADLNDIDVSRITDMSSLFWSLYPNNIDISQWDVSNVTNMNGMFFNCFNNFNADISSWDVSNVEDMNGMFWNCKKFNSDLSAWNVSNVKDMRFMFDYCDSMKELPEWYVER